jgi:hypothetical protein
MATRAIVEIDVALMSFPFVVVLTEKEHERGGAVPIYLHDGAYLSHV